MLNRNFLSDEPDEELSKDTKYDFEKFKNYEDFELDTELLSKFCPIAEKLNLSQENVEILLDLAYEMSKKQKNYYEKDEEIKLKEKTLQYSNMFNTDSEIPSLNPDEKNAFMQTANRAYSAFCSPKLKEIFKNTGLVYHPELIKMFHKIGELAQEDTIKELGTPAYEELTPAQILYGKKN